MNDGRGAKDGYFALGAQGFKSGIEANDAAERTRAVRTHEFTRRAVLAKEFFSHVGRLTRNQVARTRISAVNHRVYVRGILLLDHDRTTGHDRGTRRTRTGNLDVSDTGSSYQQFSNSDVIHNKLRIYRVDLDISRGHVAVNEDGSKQITRFLHQTIRTTARTIDFHVLTSVIPAAHNATIAPAGAIQRYTRATALSRATQQAIRTGGAIHRGGQARQVVWTVKIRSVYGG